MPKNIAESLAAAAARSRLLLADDSVELITRFLLSRQTDEGAFSGNDSGSDLYYTLFALESLEALDRLELARSPLEFLKGLCLRLDLDLVHTACLALSLAIVETADNRNRAAEMVSRLEDFRAGDGGYALRPGQARGTIYADYLVMLAGGHEQVDAGRIAGHIMSLATPDGGFANEERLAEGTTTATAAALVMLDALEEPTPEAAIAWLGSRWRDDGGFTATPRAPVPDLLSTATALHALSKVSVIEEASRRRAVEFIENHWGNDGGFFGTAADVRSDCEYTFYGLLALGSLTAAADAP